MNLLIIIMCSFLQNNSPYRNWNEDKILNYNGVYITFDYSQHSFHDKYLIKEIKIIVKNDKIVILNSSYYSTDLEKRWETLKDASIKGNYFEATEPRDFQSKSLKGEFVFKYPPSNAKGPIEKGLLIGEEFYKKNDK